MYPCSDPFTSLFFSFWLSVKREVNFLLNLFPQPIAQQFFCCCCLSGFQAEQNTLFYMLSISEFFLPLSGCNRSDFRLHCYITCITSKYSFIIKYLLLLSNTVLMLFVKLQKCSCTVPEVDISAAVLSAHRLNLFKH